ncbi:MAG: xylulokinase [Ruminococcaceae bacterium]|nr:xylulokinase [Oscillospiraceae bacterium]
MAYYIGADLGTSALKLLLVDASGVVVNSVSRSYPVQYPRPAWSEQHPADWWAAFMDGVQALLSEVDRTAVRAIGFGGQMHGLVVLDESDAVIRPAILWNDGRTAEETAYLNDTVGREVLVSHTANVAFAGFTAPKLLWMQKHEPENFKAIRKIMLPKDYMTYRLTGVHATEYSDAAGMLLLDVEHRRWSEEMAALCGITAAQLPRLFESYEAVGTLLPAVAAELGLSPEVTVVAGAGDNAAAAVGTGAVNAGDCNLSLGTSGTLFIVSDTFAAGGGDALHAFCHANGAYHLMGCMLSAASCNKWLCEDILHTTDYAAEQADISPEKLGNNHVFFLPYLMGERSPINDTDARGMFIGMRADTTRADMVQAVLEGVAFALRDSLERARAVGIAVQESTLCGGGARSPLWQTILANVLGVTLRMPTVEEGPAYGASMLAMVGDGVYPTVQDCAAKLVTFRTCVKPDAALTARYERAYQKFRHLYPAIKQVFTVLKED